MSPRVQRTLNHFWTNREKCLEGSTTHTIPWGDYPSREKHHTRILFQNINGIRRANKYSKAHIIGIGLDSLQVDIAGFAETNLDWNNFENRDTCSNIFRNYWKQTKIGMTSSTYKTNQYYQPGGVAAITGFPWASRTKVTPDKSGMGRWIESEISGKGNRKVNIITAYMVCKDSIERSGPTTAYSQQWRILKEKNPNQDLDPRITAFEDLKVRITELHRQNVEVILMLDANDSLQNTRSHFTKWVLDIGLVDPLIQRHGTTNEPPTFARGSKRIDYILASEHISEYISECGILPLHTLCFSDHRAIYVDIDLQAFLQAKPPSTLSRLSRGISSEDPRSVKKYQDALRKALDTYDFESMIKQVEEILSSDGPTVEFHRLLELIDEKFTKARLDCEEESKSKFRHPWSPALRDASYAHHYWNIWLSQKRQNKDLSSSRQRFVTHETEEYELDNTHSVKFIKFKLTQAQKRLDYVQGKAEDFRKTYLDDKAAMYAEEGNQTMENTIRRIIYHEEQSRIFQKLKWIRGKTMSGGLDYVIQIDENGQEVRTQEPEEVFDAIIQHNIKHFSQADATEFTKEPLKTILGTTGTTDACDEILQGTFRTDEVDCTEAAKSILHQLRRSVEGDISDEISAKDLIHGYRKWGEFTSTSPSGLHLSHERAVLRYMSSQREIAESTNTPTLCDRVFSIKARLLQFAVKYGHVYQRWTTVVNAMIEKTPGKPLINKLRVIHLIESDFNLLIGILWGRRLVKHGESMDLFDEGQGGSRPDRRTQELLIQKHLVYSTWRLAKINGTSFDNDAKSCFDRIVMPLASIASQQIGMPKRACELFLNTLHQMKYHIKTTAGISDKYYTTSDKFTIHGPGQGGRGSPCIWLVISSLIMKVMKSEHVKGSFLCDPDKSMEHTQHMTGFVDDITHWYSTMEQMETTMEITNQITYTAQLWTHLLSATGGKLELQKCFSYIVSWVFDEEGVGRMASLDETAMKITLQDSENHEMYDIPQKSPYDSHKTLGIMECPSGDYKDEFDRLMSKAKGFAQVLATTKLSRREAHTLYFTTFIPSMNYSGAVGTLTESQAGKIQGAVTQQFLCKMGYNRCLPSAVTYGPLSLGGVGLRDLYREQGTEKSLFALRLLRTDRPASRILRIQLAWAQHVSGISEPILENTGIRLPHLHQETWLTTLRHFLNESQLQIKIIHCTAKTPRCLNDFYLMDAACKTDLSDKTICMINRCRIYLHAETFSDVCSYSGKKINQDALECNLEARISSSRLWPTQSRPGPKHRKVWKQFLQSFCKIGTIILDNALGPWTCAIIPRKENSSLFYDPRNNQAVKFTNDTWERADITNKRTYNIIGQYQELPIQISTTHLIPADLVRLNGKSTLEWRSHNYQSTTATTTDYSSWDTYILNIPNWEQQLLKNIEWLLPTDQILSILQDENTEIFIVSDGGHSGNKGSFGWVIANQLLKMIEGYGIAPGKPMSSHRSEAFGKLSWLITLHHITLFHRFTIKCTIRSFCDNKAIVDGSKTNNCYTSLYSALCPNFDVMRSIAIKQQQLTASTSKFMDTKHVKSHQDKVKSYAELTIEEILNIRADELATRALQITQNKSEELILPWGMAYLILDSQAQSSNEKTFLQWRLSEFKLQEYYCSKFGIKIDQLESVNWAALRIARDKLSMGQKTFSIKHAIGWLATGNRMQMQGRILSDCTFCGQEEDTDHLYQCTARSDKISHTATALEKFLQEINTADEITAALTKGFKHWALGITSDHEDMSSSIKKANKEQGSIGWNLLVRGFLAKTWSEIQEIDSQGEESAKMVGDSWCSKVSLWWIQKSHELWIDRNNSLHDTSKDNDAWKDKEIRQQVRKLYDSAPYMDSSDRRIFNIPLEEKLLNSSETLQAWVRLMEPIIKKSIENQETRIKNQHQDIRTYFRNPQPTQENNSSPLPTTDHPTHIPTDTSKQPTSPNPDINDLGTANLTCTPSDIEENQPSGEMDPPDRVETPRVGDPDRAASHLRVG